MLNKKQIKALEKIESKVLPIFSIFLKTDRKSEPLDKVRITLKNLLKKQEKNFQTHSEKKFFKRISEKIYEYVEQALPQARFHGLAIFAGGDEDLFEVIEFGLIPTTIQNNLVLDKKPFLDVFDFYDKKFKKFALIVTDERKTKIFLVQGNAIMKSTNYELEIEKRSDREGVFRAKKGTGGGTAENIDENNITLKRHFKEIVVDLVEICQKEKVEALIISASPKTLPIFEKTLPKNLQKILLAKWSENLTKIDEIKLLNKIKDFEKNLK